MRLRWIGSCVLGCAGLSWAGLSLAQTASDPPAQNAAGPAPVDMAIEWVRPIRPPIHALPTGEPVSPLVAALGPVEHWTLSPQDRRLSVAMQRWTAQVGWQLLWEAERDFPIEVQVQITGTLSSALEQIMASLQDSDYPLQVVVNTQTRVLRVRRQHEMRR